MDGGQGGAGRRRRQRRGARMRPGIGRGGRGDPVDELTRGGDEGNRADFEGQRSPAVRSSTAATRATRSGAGRRRRCRRASRERRARARDSLLWGRAGHALPRGGGGHACLADGLSGSGGRAGVSWVGPQARPNPVG
jgi:hypothetical protein